MITSFSFNSTGKSAVEVVNIYNNTVINLDGLVLTGEDVKNALIDGAILKKELKILQMEIDDNEQ